MFVESTTLNIGFDDTDSTKGMCTTYLAYRLVDSLKKDKVKFVDYPRLIRFNPNIPWKTRGNGAVSIKIETTNPAKIKNKVIQFVTKFSDLKNGANPGVVFFENTSIPQEFTEFSRQALWKLISRKQAKTFIAKHNLQTFHLGNGQGLIGAIGAIGYKFNDYTFELLSYRKKSQFGKKRKIVSDSVKHMQEKTYPKTFNSFDTKKQRVIFAPHGPDPVFFGIRGEDTTSLLNASKMIKTKEKPIGHLIFKSNQGTGDHLQNELDVHSLKPYSSGTIVGTVCREPIIERGGHVKFSILRENVEIVCFVYKPTGITNHASNLIIGDVIRIGGGIRKSSVNHGRALNVEFFEILKLATEIILANPLCVKCNKKMKSKGRNQGFVCIKCGETNTQKTRQIIPRKIQSQLYIPQPSAHRHLTRPQQRINIVNKATKFESSSNWFSNYN
jgi:tRNA(Ile2)-agmatinylcytidine synthase